MAYKIMMQDLIEGLNSVLLLQCLSDVIHLSSKTERISLVDELNTRFMDGKPTDPQDRVMSKLNFELIKVFEENTGRQCKPEILPHLKSDFIFIQEFLYSSIPKFDNFDVERIEVCSRIIFVDGNHRKSNSYSFE